MMSCGMYSVQTNRFKSFDFTSTLFAGAGQSKPEGAFFPLDVETNGAGVGGSVGFGVAVGLGGSVALAGAAVGCAGGSVGLGAAVGCAGAWVGCGAGVG